MTKNQINTILTAYGEKTATLTSLDKVASIQLITNQYLYPSKTMKYIFDSTNDILLEYKLVGDKNILNVIYDYESICGFTSVNQKHPKEAYKKGGKY